MKLEFIRHGICDNAATKHKNIGIRHQGDRKYFFYQEFDLPDRISLPDDMNKKIKYQEAGTGDGTN